MSNSSINYNVVSTFSGTNSTQEFRLSLTNTSPVMTSAYTAADTIYLVPYVGKRISLYLSSGVWEIFESTGQVLSLSGTLANTNYDIFAYADSGTVLLERLSWSVSTAGNSTRSSSLAYQDGILVKSGDPTRRYLGTIRTTGVAGQTEFSYGAIGTSNIEAKLYVWNYYNRVLYSARVSESTDSWTYGTSTWRSANNNTAYRVSFICGLSEDRIQSSYGSYAITNASSIGAGQAIGLNSTSVFSGLCAFTQNTAGTPQGRYEGLCATGFNFVQALEICNPTGTATFYGDAGFPATYQLSALHFSFMM